MIQLNPKCEIGKPFELSVYCTSKFSYINLYPPLKFPSTPPLSWPSCSELLPHLNLHFPYLNRYINYCTIQNFSWVNQKPSPFNQIPEHTPTHIVFTVIDPCKLTYELITQFPENVSLGFDFDNFQIVNKNWRGVYSLWWSFASFCLWHFPKKTQWEVNLISGISEGDIYIW